MKNRIFILALIYVAGANIVSPVFAKCAGERIENGVCLGVICCDGGCYGCCDPDLCSGSGGGTIDPTEPGCILGPWKSSSDGIVSGCPDGVATRYACAAGTYGAWQLIPSRVTCTSCADATGNSAATSADGAKEITECYIPSNTSFSDGVGSGQYTSDCYYSE